MTRGGGRREAPPPGPHVCRGDLHRYAAPTHDHRAWGLRSAPGGRSPVTWTRTAGPRSRPRIRQRLTDGTISMPELVAQIRTSVAGAETLQIIQVESLVAVRLGPDGPPARRSQRGAEAAQAELQAKVANATKSGRGVTVNPEGGQLTVSMTGVEVSGSVGKAEVSAGAGPGGVKAEGKAGGVETEVEASPEKVEVAGKAHKVLFRAAVEGAHEAVGAAVRHVSRGGRPTDATVRGGISGKVKPRSTPSAGSSRSGALRT